MSSSAARRAAPAEGAGAGIKRSRPGSISSSANRLASRSGPIVVAAPGEPLGDRPQALAAVSARADPVAPTLRHHLVLAEQLAQRPELQLGGEQVERHLVADTDQQALAAAVRGGELVRVTPRAAQAEREVEPCPRPASGAPGRRSPCRRPASPPSRPAARRSDRWRWCGGRLPRPAASARQPAGTPSCDRTPDTLRASCSHAFSLGPSVFTGHS